MLPLSFGPEMLNNFSWTSDICINLRLSAICNQRIFFSRGWEAGENVLITWFSIADKQDKLYQVYAAPALTNQRDAFICVLQSE